MPIAKATSTPAPWEVVFYHDHRGRSPVLDFIRGLQAKDRAKIDSALSLLQDYGTALGMPHARPVEGRLWELRPGGIRLFYFAYIKRQFVILHGYRKQSQKAPGREIEIALRRMNELLEERNESTDDNL